MWCFKFLCLFLSFVCGLSSSTRPNIIVIVADDIGWNDVGFHGSDEIPTPNIDALAYNGVILNNHYTQCMCTPSRSAFLTGKYPIHLGMQHLVILEPEPWGLGLNETLLPQHLKRHGYVTHALGKWHLGFFKKEYTPTYRGFDSHFGYWQGFQDYYTHEAHSLNKAEAGYDMRRNMTVDWDSQGKYSTHLYTEEAVKLIHEHDINKPIFMYLAHLAPHTGNSENPLQAPDEEIAKLSHILDPERRTYAAMVTVLDHGVGRVMTALREKGMLENSIVVFIGDNGAQTVGIHANHGSNYPLRGMKQSAWDGGMRGVSAIWSPLIKKTQRVTNKLMHITDWLPTFYSAAGLNTSELGYIDGLDMWKVISEDATSPRTEFVYNIDPIDNYFAIRNGDWKYMQGTTYDGNYDLWYGSSGKDEAYSYDEVAVLRSPTAAVLAGFITKEQIQQKHNNMKFSIQNMNNFTVNLLNTETVLKLREAATLRCPQINQENIPEDHECKPLESSCLFNLKDDPCERINLVKTRPEVVANMQQMLINIQKTAITPRNLPRDLKANPIHWNNTWVPWQDCVELENQQLEQLLSPALIFLIAAACFICLLAMIVTIIKYVKQSKKSKNIPISAFEEDAEELRNVKVKGKAFVDRETSTHNSYKESLKSIE